jgi:HEAT repeat protein
MRIGFRIAFGVLFLAMLGWLTIQPNEPRYQGKRLSQWLAELDLRNSEEPGARNEAIRAVRALGTNALPRLTSMLCVKDSVWTKALLTLNSRQGVVRFPVTPASVVQARAVQGYAALGGLAESNVPELVRILEAEPLAQIRAYIVLALGQIGGGAKGAIPALRKAADDKNEQVRQNARWALLNVEMWNESPIQ